jgi:hypothetical protein
MNVKGGVEMSSRKYDCYVTDPKIVKRWNGIAMTIGLEHEVLPTSPDDEVYGSEISDERKYYGIAEGVTYDWFKREAEYWLSCYYEVGHCRCDERFEDEECYKTWVSETGKLKRFIAAVKKKIKEIGDEDYVVIEWK